MRDKKIKNAEEYLSLQETAKLLRVSIPTLRNWDKRGTFVAYRNPANNYRVYRISQIEKFIDDMEGSRKGKRFRVKVVKIEN